MRLHNHLLAVALPLALATAGAAAQPIVVAADSAARLRGALPAVVVIGTDAAVLTRIPGAATAVAGSQISALAALSAKEALRLVPGVHVTDEDAFGLNLNIGVRGLPPRRSTRVLLLEDGMPIHLGPYSDPSAHYHPPIDALERIEVVKGSAQIAFGPQTIGGVINMVRRAPPAVPTLRLALTGGSADVLTGRVGFGGTWRSVGVNIDAARREGDGTRVGQHHRIEDLTVRAVLPLGDAQRLALTAGAYREASRYGEAGLSQTEFERDPFQNPLPHDVFDLTRAAVQVVHEARFGTRATLRTQAYGQQLDRTAWRQASTSADRLGNAAYERNFRCAAGATSIEQCGNTGRPRAYGFAGLEPRLSLSHGLPSGRGVLETGVRVHRETMRRQERAGLTFDARSGDLTRDNAIDTDARSLFVLERLQRGALTVSPGIRIEEVRSLNTNRLAGTRNRDRYAEVLPGLGIAWAPGLRGSRAATVIAGIHRGFAPPRPADVLNPVSGEGLVQVDAEVSWTSELGVRSTLTDGVTVDLTAFRIDFDNQVVSGALIGSGQRFVNAGRTLHQGLEAGASVSMSRLFGGRVASRRGDASVDAALTWLPTARFASDRNSTVDSRQSVLGRRVPFAPELVLHGGAAWRGAGGTSIRLDADVVSAQFSDDLNSVPPTPDGRRGRIPGYTVLNASARLPFARAAGRAAGRAAATLSVKNLTNRAYITDRQEGIMTGMPRRVFVGLDLVY